jgi:hypothetical protein
MEDAMLHWRIVTAGAVLVVMAGSAMAQGAGATTPGKPMSLLQILLHPAKGKPKPHTRLAHKATPRSARSFAARRSHHLVAHNEDPEPAPEIPPPNLWPALDGDVSAANAAATATQTNTTTAAENLSAMVVDGRTVQIVSPDAVNAIDLAADEPHDVTAARDNRADREPAAASVAFAQEDDGGTQSWTAELLATLGGALAAGSVGWFLFGSRSTPMRGYG